jgi:hypothetical protein
MDLERWEVKLMGEQAHDQHSFDGWDVSVGLEELHVRMAGVEDGCTVEAMGLSPLVMEIFDTVVHLGVFPNWNIPWLIKSAREVLAAAGLILERM